MRRCFFLRLPRKSEKSVKIGKNHPINRPLIGGIGQWGEACHRGGRLAQVVEAAASVAAPAHRCSGVGVGNDRAQTTEVISKAFNGPFTTCPLAQKKAFNRHFVFFIVSYFLWRLQPSTTTTQKTRGTPGSRIIEFSLTRTTFSQQ